jgi:hypothetical protein
MLVVGLLGTTLGITVGTASATAPQGSKAAYCKAVLELGTDVTQPSDDATTIPADTAADLEAAFKKVAKLAPTKAIKKADLTIADYYGQIADGKTPADISSEDGEAYSKAIAKFGTYLATKCITAAIPDVTLPGGGKVEIPGT